MEGYEASTYGDRFAEVYDDWYEDITDVARCTEHLAALARGGPVLELGIGSGRLALPLVERGLDVHGVEASAAMVERLRAKPHGERVRVALGDMAELALVDPPPFRLVFVAFNTFFNLATAALQERCLARVAALLAPDGFFVIEAFVPSDDVADAPVGSVVPKRITADEVVLTVSHTDPIAQTVTGQHVHLSESGIALRPWHLRWATPAQLDAMAAAAGLVLVDRSGGWEGQAFTDDSGVHVSTYRPSNVDAVREHPPADAR